MGVVLGSSNQGGRSWGHGGSPSPLQAASMAQRRPNSKKIQKGIPRSSVDLLRGSQGAFYGGLWAFLGGRMGVGLNPDVRACDMG